jgi:MFS family permease
LGFSSQPPPDLSLSESRGGPRSAAVSRCALEGKGRCSQYDVHLPLSISGSPVASPSLSRWAGAIATIGEKTYAVFISGSLVALVLLLPLDLTWFTIGVVALGVTQGIGKASTIKYIPLYYPRDVGAVVGLVGCLASLGGFAMPPLFAYLKEWTGEARSMFGVVLALSLTSLLWLHVVVSRLPRARPSRQRIPDPREVAA